MRHIASRILLTAGIFFCLAQNAHAAGVNTDGTVSDLPIGAGGGLAATVYPSVDSNDVIFSGNVGILTGGTRPAHPLVVNGEADIGSLTLGGSGALTSTSAKTLISLQGTTCTEALSYTYTNPGVISCVNIVDLAAVGTYDFPSPPCPTDALTWNGTTGGFSCVAVAPPIGNTSCGAGEAFTIFGSGAPSCSLVVADTSCTSPEFVTGFSSGAPSCGATVPGALAGTYSLKVPDHIDYGYAKASTQECPYVDYVTVIDGVITNITASPGTADTGSANYLSGYAPCTG